MIKIKIESATGAEARAELLALLGGSLPAPATVETFKPEVSTTETAPPTVEETTTRKRRTKAEIVAEEAAAKELVNEPEPTIEQANETQEVKHPELVDLQRICAVIVRAGHKQKGIDVIKNTGKADSSKDVAPELRQACIDELNAFADENKITR
jgi:hypothetical protein